MGVSVEQVDGQDHLQQVDSDCAVGDFDADRRPCRARCVLQVRDVVDVEIDGYERIRCGVRNVVDRNDGQRAREREVREEGSHGVGRRGRRHDGGGAGVGERSFETFGMPLEFRREQRHRDRARLDRREEAGDVVEALRREDRHPVTT